MRVNKLGLIVLINNERVRKVCVCRARAKVVLPLWVFPTVMTTSLFMGMFSLAEVYRW